LFSLAFAFMAVFVTDLVSDTNERGLIMDSIIPQAAAFEEEPPLCDPDYNACGPLMSNYSGSRYCCAGTNSDCCYAAYC